MPKLKRGSKAHFEKVRRELEAKVLQARKLLKEAHNSGDPTRIAFARDEAASLGKLLEVLE